MPRIVLLLSSIAAALLLASGVGLLNAVKPAEATFPGVNGRIAYAGVDPVEGDVDIYTMNANGGDKLNVTNDTDGDYGRNDSYPSYSPNADKLVYVNFDWDEFGEVANAVYTITLSGGARSKVVEGGSGFFYFPTYAPDGNRIAYQGYDESIGGKDETEIYTINATGGGRVQVTNNDLDEGQPDYSPSGQRIAFSGWDGNDWEIYTIKAGGGGRIQVTNNNRPDVSPSYSPNGKKIAYAHRDGYSNDYDIDTINAGGGGVFQVTRNKSNEAHDFDPSYSPDGKRIAYSGWDGTDSEIYKISPTGGTPIPITNNNTDDERPSWGSQ